jgi:hypothetical protein
VTSIRGTCKFRFRKFVISKRCCCFPCWERAVRAPVLVRTRLYIKGPRPSRTAHGTHSVAEGCLFAKADTFETRRECPSAKSWHAWGLPRWQVNGGGEGRKLSPLEGNFYGAAVYLHETKPPSNGIGKFLLFMLYHLAKL